MRDPQVPGWADYPNLGVDDRALYLTYNVKNVKARLLVFEKTDLYDDGSARAIDLGTLQNPGGGNALSVQPCHHFGPVTSAHLVNTLNLGTQLANAIVVRSVRWQARARPRSAHRGT